MTQVEHDTMTKTININFSESDGLLVLDSVEASRTEGIRPKSWPMYQRDRENSGVYPHMIMPFGRMPLGRQGKEVSSLELSGSPGLTSPVVIGDYLISVGGENLHLFNHATGEELWSFNAGASIHSTPVIVGDYVILGNGHGVITCLNIEDMEKEWSTTVEGLRTSLVEFDGIIYLSDENNQVRAIDVSNGVEYWSKKINSESDSEGNFFTSSISQSIAVDNESIYFATANQFYALDRRGGEVHWHSKDFAGGYRPSPVLWDNYVTVGGFDGIYTFHKRTGNVVGYIDTDGRVDGNGAIYDKNFYISNMSGELLRTDLKRGEIVWKKSLIPKGMVTPTISGGMGNIWVPHFPEERRDLYFISTLSHSDGEMLAETGNYYASTPFAIADDSIFFPHLREKDWYISKMGIPVSSPDDESLRELQNLFDDAIKGIGNKIIIPILAMIIYDLLKSRRDEIKLVIQGEETNIDRDSIEDRLNEVYDKLVNKSTQSIEESYGFIRRIWKFMNSDDEDKTENDDLDEDS